MKTVGIVVDNYKIEKFKRELNAKGFEHIEVVPLNPATSNIKVITEESRIREIRNICTACELYFKRSN